MPRQRSICNPERIGFEELQRELLCQHDVTDGKQASGRETQQLNLTAVLIELLDVHRVAISDAVAPTGVATDHVEVAILGVLLALLGREIEGKQPRSSLVWEVYR